MRVYLLARRLRVKSADIVEKLALLKIDGAPSSKIDDDAVKKVKLLVGEPPRVEQVTEALDLSVEKILKKLKAMNIEVVSHLSVLQEPELARLLRSKNLDRLRLKPKAKKPKRTKPKVEVLKIKPKKKRVFEVAVEIGVSEGALLRKLRKLNTLAMHRRSPLDAELIELLKKEKYTLKDKVFFRLRHMFDAIPGLLRQTRKIFMMSGFYTVIALLLASFAFTNVLEGRTKLFSQREWEVGEAKLGDSAQVYQVLETVALLEIKKLKLKVPIIEQGSGESPIINVLVRQNNAIDIGSEGTSVLKDKQGVLSKTLAQIKAGDILVITNLDRDMFFYRVLSGKDQKKPKKSSFGSAIKIVFDENRKIIAGLQKVE